jgi:hypothetical protein
VRTAVVFFILIAALRADMEWRQSPQPLVRKDSVPHAIRSARDKRFDRIYGPPPKGWVTSGPDKMPMFEEIPVSYGPLTTVLVQFASYTTIRSASGKSIYTEVRMDVQEGLKDPSGTVRAGEALTVILGGGSLRLPSGKIVREYLDQDSDLGLEPGHRYLAFIAYEKDGDYFDGEKCWNLTTGFAVPEDPSDLKLAREGNSHFAGMPEDKFLLAVKEMLSK